MKRLIAALVVGWGLIYATNHLLLPRAPTESKVAVQSEQITDHTINSWGPYLPHVKHLEPNDMAQTSLKSRQTQEPAASEDGLVQLSSRDIHAQAVPLEERTSQVARIEKPTSAAYQHDVSQSSLQDLKPNSAAVALEERTLGVARVKNPPMAAVRQHDGILLSLPNLMPNSEANATEDRTLQVARVENPPTAAAYQHDGIQLSSPDPKPNSEAVASAERTLQASNRPAGSTSIALVEIPPPSRKPRSPVAAAKARIAQVTAGQDHPRHLATASQRHGLGLFIFAPPGF